MMLLTSFSPIAFLLARCPGDQVHAGDPILEGPGQLPAGDVKDLLHRHSALRTLHFAPRTVSPHFTRVYRPPTPRSTSPGSSKMGYGMPYPIRVEDNVELTRRKRPLSQGLSLST